MNVKKQETEILPPINQLNLYGYKDYFNFFIKLSEKGEMPNSMLFSGPKGSGKSTFVYHVVNYLLSKHEEKKYSINNFSIDQDNPSYKLLIKNIHPNFFLVENNPPEEDIKIEQIRNLLKFLNKSTYSRNIKIIMIDNVENLNLNSSSALLKSIEEPQNNTFFFIVHDNSCKILDTIKSRCTEFRFMLTTSKKKLIFKNIIKQYKINFEINKVVEDYYFDTPGNIIKYFLVLDNININVTENTLRSIFYFIDKYKNEKNSETLPFLSLFIQKFYNELCLNNNKNLNNYSFNLLKILKQIDDMKKFNLDKKNVLIWIKNILQNETK